MVFRAGLVASRGEAGQGEEASGGDAGHGAVDGGKSEANGGSSAGDAMGGQISDGGERPSKDDVAGEQDPDGDVDALDIANAPNGSSSAINAGKGTTGWDTRTLRKRGWQMVDNGAFMRDDLVCVWWAHSSSWFVSLPFCSMDCLAFQRQTLSLVCFHSRSDNLIDRSAFVFSIAVTLWMADTSHLCHHANRVISASFGLAAWHAQTRNPAPAPAMRRHRLLRSPHLGS